MVQAVIFDCFGVLATDGWLPFKSKYFAHDKALLKQAGYLNKQNDAGLSSYKDFTENIGKLAGLPAESVRTAIEGNVPNEALFTYIQKLKPKYKIGMLSNAGSDWLSKMFTKDQIGLFDAIALSYETGFIKPQEEAFQVILDRLDVDPTETVFVDDQPLYGEGAKALGIKFIHYQDNEQTIAELNRVLADSK